MTLIKTLLVPFLVLGIACHIFNTTNGKEYEGSQAKDYIFKREASKQTDKLVDKAEALQKTKKKKGNNKSKTTKGNSMM